MTTYYTNKSDFDVANLRAAIVPSTRFHNKMEKYLQDIESVGNKVLEEGAGGLVETGDSYFLGATLPPKPFDTAYEHAQVRLEKAGDIHVKLIQNVDNKFTKGMNEAFKTLDKVNGSKNQYKTSHLKRKERKFKYKADKTGLTDEDYEYKPYTLSEILDGKASPIQAAKDLYNDRLAQADLMLANLDKLSDEQVKNIKGKSAEEIVAAMYPTELPDYQALKADRRYEENKKVLAKWDLGLKIGAAIGMIGGVVAAPFTGGSSLALTYASATYLTVDSAYAAVTGHTMVTGDVLTTEERVWAGIDAVAMVASMGSAGYLAKVGKSGGSTLFKNIAKIGKHADDINDGAKVVYAAVTGDDPSDEMQNLIYGQAIGLGVDKVGGKLGDMYTNFKSRGKVPDIDIDMPHGSQFATAGDLPNLSAQDINLSKLNKPGVEADIPSVKNVADLNLPTKPAVDLSSVRYADVDLPNTKAHADLNLTNKANLADGITAAGVGAKAADLDVPKVKGVHSSNDTSLPKVESPTFDRNRVLNNIEASRQAREASNFDQYLVKEKAAIEQLDVPKVEDVQHYTSWDDMKADHYRTVTEFVKANKPEGAAHPREWLSKPGHEFTIESMSDGTQVWKYKNDLGVEKIYVDGVLEGAGIPNPKVTQHFEDLNPKIKGFDPDVASTSQKANAGEILADDNMRIVRESAGANQHTYTLENIGRPAPTDLDDPIVKGIDGIYKNQTPPPSYVINEAKWGSSEINQHTLDGPQMSEKWVRSRLGDLDPVDQISLEMALDAGDVEFVISKVDTSGSVSTYYAEAITDSTGRVIKVEPGARWP